MLSTDEKPDSHKCERCGNFEAEYRINPYDNEINGEISYIWVCEDCYDELLADI